MQVTCKCLCHPELNFTVPFLNPNMAFRYSFKILRKQTVIETRGERTNDRKITLSNRKKKGLFIPFREVKMSRGIFQTSPRGWFPQIFLLIQVAGRLKSRFSSFLTFLAYRVQDCSYSGAVQRVQLDRVDSSAPCYTVGSIRKSVSWSQRGDVRTPFVIVARYDGI